MLSFGLHIGRSTCLAVWQLLEAGLETTASFIEGAAMSIWNNGGTLRVCIATYTELSVRCTRDAILKASVLALTKLRAILEFVWDHILWISCFSTVQLEGFVVQSWNCLGMACITISQPIQVFVAFLWGVFGSSVASAGWCLICCMGCFWAAISSSVACAERYQSYVTCCCIVVFLHRLTSGRMQTARAEPEPCAVCLSAQRSHALDPCGHLCACYNCATKLNSCPMCRRPISRILQIYQ